MTKFLLDSLLVIFVVYVTIAGILAQFLLSYTKGTETGVFKRVGYSLMIGLSWPYLLIVWPYLSRR